MNEFTRNDALEAHMDNLYSWLCKQPDEQASVAALEDYALRDLLGYLGRMQVLSGVPGMIYGHALVEAAQRFAKQPAND